MHHSFITVVPRGRVSQCLVAIVLGLAIFFIAAPADAQSPAVRYERALAREKAARTMTGTSAATIRTIAPLVRSDRSTRIRGADMRTTRCGRARA